MSPPAAKARSPAAMMTTRVTAASCAHASSCARKASTMAWLTALSTLGRLSVTTPAAPRRSNRISSVIAHSLSAHSRARGNPGRNENALMRGSPLARGRADEAIASRSRRPDARLLQPVHGLIGELGLRRVAADHEHQDRFLVRVALAHVFETADHARRERQHVERPEVDELDLAVLILPARAPGAGHRDEGLVGVVVVHLGAMAGLGLAVAEVEALADLDGGHFRRVVADRRSRVLADVVRRLEPDDVEQRAFAARHLAVGQPAVGAFELLEARDPFFHLGARKIFPWQLFHRSLPFQFPSMARPTIMRMISLVPSRIWCTRTSRNT